MTAETRAAESETESTESDGAPDPEASVLEAGCGPRQFQRHRVPTLEEGDCVLFSTADGGEWELVLEEHGRLAVVSRGDAPALVVVPGPADNVCCLQPWPSFQPVRPPTLDSPVQVSRALVLEVAAPRLNGVPTEAVEAVQADVDADPTFRRLLEDAVRRRLYKVPSRADGSGYESVRVRPGPPGAPARSHEPENEVTL